MVNSRAKNYVIFLLAAATVAGGMLAWNQYQALVKLRADSLSSSVRDDLQKRLWNLEKRNKQLEAEVASLRAGNADGTGDNVAADDPQASADPRQGRFNRRNGPNNLATLLENPEFNKLWTAQQKAALDARYNALFKNLKLSPADLEKFKSLLVEKQTSMMDVMAAARDQGLNPRNPDDRAQIASLIQAAQSQVDNNIRQTLGDAQYGQYQNYEQTLPQRNLVTQLAQTLSASGAPLQDYQTQQLVSILAANTPVRSQGSGSGGGMFAAFGGDGGGIMGGVFGGRTAPITDAAVTQAQSILSPQQVAALQQMQTQQQAQQQLQQMMRQAFGNNGTQQPAASGTAAATGTTAATTSTKPPTTGG